MVHIVSIADAWGSSYGGINTLNFELCKAFAKNPNVRIICVLPYVENGYCVDSHVHLIGVYSTDNNRNYAEGWEHILREKLYKNGFNITDIDFCIGHDILTGKEVLHLKEYNPSFKAIIFSHQAYPLYTAIKNNDGSKAITKGDEQLNVYKRADILLCVGPLLFSYFEGKDQLSSLKKNNKIIEFIPGLPDVRTSEAEPNSFSLMTMGRFDDDGKDVKGVNTIVKSFAIACKEARPIFGDSPTMTVFGLSTNSEINSQQSIDIMTMSGELSEKYIPVNATPFSTDRETLLNHVRNSSCVAMLSLQDGFGLVGWESIACGVPLLLSENTGLFKLLKNRRLENLVTFVDVNNNNNDVFIVKNKLVEIASNPQNVKDDALKLLSVLKTDFSWDNVISSLLQKMEVVFESNKDVSQQIEGISKKSSKNSLEVVRQFYDAIHNKNYQLAWNLLSHDFQNRGIWKSFTDFESGYSNFVGISNIRIFESVKAYSSVEYNVFFDDIREVPIEPIMDDVRFYTISQKKLFMKKINELVKKLIAMGVDEDKINNLNLSQFFSSGIEDYLMFKLDLYDLIPRGQRRHKEVSRFYRCHLITENDTWKIERILPVRFTDRT